MVFSCSKKTEDRTYRYVSGTVLADCAGTPLRGQKLQLVRFTNTSLSCNTTPAETYTDDNGRYVFEYAKDCPSTSFADEVEVVVADGPLSGTVVVTHVPADSTVDLGAQNLVLKSQVFVQIQLAAGRISGFDTLYFGTGTDQYYAIYPLATKYALYEFPAAPALFANRNPTKPIYYGLGKDGYLAAINASATALGNVLSYHGNGCSGSIDTVTINIK